jgi:hypothetical protein
MNHFHVLGTGRRGWANSSKTRTMQLTRSSTTTSLRWQGISRSSTRRKSVSRTAISDSVKTHRLQALALDRTRQNVLAQKASPMTQPTPKVIRCGIPDCDWGTPFSVFGEEIEDCCRQYRKHCIDRHRRNPTNRAFLLVRPAGADVHADD